MKLLILILSFFIQSVSLFAVSYGSLPESRFSKWHDIPIGFSGVWDTVNVATKGILPDQKGDIATKFQDILDNHSGNVVYYFPEGTYYFEAPIQIKVNRVDNDNVIIKGAGKDKTKFLFDCDVDYFGGLIWCESKPAYGERNNPIDLVTIPKKGDSSIELASSSSKLEVGGLLCLKSDNPTELMYPAEDVNQAWYIKWKNGEADWGDESYGEFHEIKAINGNIVTLKEPVQLDYDKNYNPRASIYPLKDLVKNVGLEDFYIEHIIDDSKYVAGGINDIFDIVFRFAKNCYVNNVESYNTARGHVIAEYGYNIAIKNSKFSYARNYGVGGAGYGICVQNRSSDIVIENNEFKHLRHAVVLKEGANRVVVSYNYSHDWAILDPMVVDDNGDKIEAEADMSIHGFYSHNNLFEGNVVHNIFVADYWGPAGPNTTLFRNKSVGVDTLDGFYVDDYSHHENLINNVIVDKSKLFVNSNCEDAYVEANVTNGVAQYNTLTSSSIIPKSLYLDSKPIFWQDNLAWPPFGSDVVNSQNNTIPAMVNSQTSAISNINHNKSVKQVELSIYPNPFNPTTTISFNSILKNSKVNIYDISGKLLLSKIFNKKGKNCVLFNGAKYSSGIYLVKLVNGNNSISKKMVLIK